MKKKTTVTERHQTFWLGQNLGDKIFVLRGFRVTLRLYSPEIYDDTEIVKQEIRRLYISPDDSYKEYCGWEYDEIKKEFARISSIFYYFYLSKKTALDIEYKYEKKEKKRK